MLSVSILVEWLLLGHWQDFALSSTVAGDWLTERVLKIPNPSVKIQQATSQSKAMLQPELSLIIHSAEVPEKEIALIQSVAHPLAQ